MSSPQVTWKRLDPALKAVVKPCVKEWGWVLPPWLATLHFRPLDGTTDDEEGILANTDLSMYRYREITIQVGSRLLLHPSATQSRTILHEFIHVVLAPIFTIVDKLELQSPIPDLLEEGHEQAVEDMVNTLLRYRGNTPL